MWNWYTGRRQTRVKCSRKRSQSHSMMDDTPARVHSRLSTHSKDTNLKVNRLRNNCGINGYKVFPYAKWEATATIFDQELFSIPSKGIQGCYGSRVPQVSSL